MTPPKTLNTRAWYFSAIVPFFSKIFNNMPQMIVLGYKFNKNETHSYLKTRFDLESTKRFTAEDWSNYILQLQHFASETYDIYLPDPESFYE